MSQLPHLDWISTTFFFGTITAASGLLQGLLSGRIIDIFVGLFLFPIFAIILNSVIISLIVITFAVYYERYVSWRRLAHVVSFAAVPYLAIHPLSAFLGLFDLIGFALQCYFLVIGISRNLDVRKQQVIRVVGFVYCIFLAVWSVQRLLT